MISDLHMKYNVGDWQILLDRHSETMTAIKGGVLLYNGSTDSAVRPPMHTTTDDALYEAIYFLYHLGKLLDKNVIESVK